jgi:hypothetical protein
MGSVLLQRDRDDNRVLVILYHDIIPCFDLDEMGRRELGKANLVAGG